MTIKDFIDSFGCLAGFPVQMIMMFGAIFLGVKAIMILFGWIF